MSMSKKDFIALADAVKDIRGLLERGIFNATREPNREIKVPFAMEQVEQVLADFCQSSNPRFMRDRWLGYIAGTNGKNGGSVKSAKPTYEVQGNYGQGWETVCTEEGSVDARQRLREYRENEPQYAHRLVRA